MKRWVIEVVDAMIKGSLNELVLTRSVIKHIRKHNKKITQGVGVGNDYAEIDDIVSAEGVHENPEIAWVKAQNNFAVSKAKALGVRIVALLPEDIEEKDIKLYMNTFNRLADNENLSILGGHTEVREYYKVPSFTVTMLGKSIGTKKSIKDIKPGMDIIMTGYTGIYGTDVLVANGREQLMENFAESYIDGAVFGSEQYCISKIAEKLDAYYMHDVSYGGVYGALWQLGVKIKKGIEIYHELIPIRQETIEICESFNINPYLLEGTGAMLAVVNDGEQLVEGLSQQGINASVIGKVVSGNEKYVIMSGEKGEKRYLNPVSGDELVRCETNLYRYV